MKKYLISRITDSVDWNTIPVLDIDTVYTEKSSPIEAHAQIAYNDEALLVRLWTLEPNYLAEQSGPLVETSMDSCLEFFFSGDIQDSRYLNFEFNPNGSIYLGLGCMEGNPRLIRMVVNHQDIFSPSIIREESGWSVAYRIPYNFIRYFFPEFQPEKGKSISANCYKCSDCSQPPHYMSWSPVPWGVQCFHRRDHFGIMQFE